MAPKAAAISQSWAAIQVARGGKLEQQEGRFVSKTTAEQLATLRAYQLPGSIKQANVLLLGPAGAGKSSLVSTLDSLVRGRMTRRADYGGATKSLTMDLRAYQFGKGSTQLPLVLWDTRGWCPDSYTAGELGTLLDGHLPSRTSMASALTPRDATYIKQPTTAQRMHCLLMCIPAPSATDTTYLARLQELKQYATARGVRVLVALTKVDEYDPDVASNLDKVQDSPKILSLMARLSQASGVPRNNILPVKSFFTEYDPEDNPGVAPLVYHLLYQALLCCSTYLEEEADIASTSADEGALT